MITEKMNVHKALCELKTIDDRINDATTSGVFVACNRHNNTKIDGMTVADYRNNVIKSSYDSVNALIKRRDALKKAVTKSNAVTKVNINGYEYTVVEAIYMKDKGMVSKGILLRTLQNQYNRTVSEIRMHSGDSLQIKAETYVTNMVGGKDKLSSEEIKKQMADYIEANTYDLVDPMDILGEIKKLESEIAEYMAEVDSALSVSNAITEIEITY